MKDCCSLYVGYFFLPTILSCTGRSPRFLLQLCFDTPKTRISEVLFKTLIFVWKQQNVQKETRHRIFHCVWQLISEIAPLLKNISRQRIHFPASRYEQVFLFTYYLLCRNCVGCIFNKLQSIDRCAHFQNPYVPLCFHSVFFFLFAAATIQILLSRDWSFISLHLNKLAL